MTTKPEEQTIPKPQRSQVAIRDYIPQGEDLSPQEAAALKGKAAVRTGSFRPDYVPAEGQTAKPASGRVAQADAALQKALERQEHAVENEFRVAKERLAAWSVQEAIMAIAVMPSRVADMYVVAEQQGAQREDVLNQFAAPDPAVVQLYARPTSTEGKSDAETGTASEAPEE